MQTSTVMSRINSTIRFILKFSYNEQKNAALNGILRSTENCLLSSHTLASLRRRHPCTELNVGSRPVSAGLELGFWLGLVQL